MEISKTVTFDQYKGSFRFQTTVINLTATGEYSFLDSLTDLITKLNEGLVDDFCFKPDKVSILIRDLESSTTITTYPIVSVGIGTGVNYNSTILGPINLGLPPIGLVDAYIDHPIKDNMVYREDDFIVKIESAGVADDSFNAIFIIEGQLIDTDA